MTARAHGLLLTVAVVVVACSGASGATACSDPEQLLEPSNIHVLPGAEVAFEHSPPTSGPHEIPAPAAGVHDSPIAEPRQVAAVEAGMVLLQHGPAVSAADVESLRQLADDQGVIVAPGVRPFDEGASVAFTAWGTRQLCTGLDVEAARAFVDRTLGEESHHDGGG